MEVHVGPSQMSDARSSDHALVSLSFQNRGMGQHNELRIPDFIFQDPRYRAKLAALVSAVDMSHVPAD
eukprot:7419992-Pyramimonas_sp.AAC.1